MTDLAAAQGLGLAGAWLLGLSAGITACTISCLPYMGAWVLGREGGGGAAFADAGAFLTGRIAGYGALGSIGGLAGGWLGRLLEGGIGHFWIGLGALLACVAVLRGGSGRNGCRSLKLAGWPPVILGAALALVPCPPLAALLAASAASGSVAAGAAYGLAFGIGAAITPLVLVLPMLGAFGGLLRQEQPWLGRWLRIGAAAVLGIIGLDKLYLAASAL